MGASSLDQLLESSTSTLSFVVDSDLAQYLRAHHSREATIGRPSHHHQNSLALRTSANGQASGGGQTKPQGISFKTKKATLVDSQRRSTSGHLADGDRGVRFALDIKCIARVLHLSMSDEIKLRLVNASKASSRPLASIETQPQERRVQSSSTGGKFLLIVAAGESAMNQIDC